MPSAARAFSFCLCPLLMLSAAAGPPLPIAPPPRMIDAGNPEGVWALVTDPGTDKEKVDRNTLIMIENGRLSACYLRGEYVEIVTFPVAYERNSRPGTAEFSDIDPKSKAKVLSKVIYRIDKYGMMDWCVGKEGKDRPLDFKNVNGAACFKFKRIAINIDDYMKLKKDKKDSKP